METLLEIGYPDAAGLSEAEFISHIEPLKERLGDLPLDQKHEAGSIPLRDRRQPQPGGRPQVGVADRAPRRVRVLAARHRSPLTIAEGIAVLTHHPEAVARNAGFSLLGSRREDRRVTAFWISDGRPKLGWCWAGNPHTWLGSASCAARIGR